jgi:ribosomal protein S18 acetylase RimI-like enzyme
MKICLDTAQNLYLNPIQPDDQQVLYSLMDEIYRASYSSFWYDQGDWYLDLIYNPVNVEKELGRTYSHYFFVEKGEKKIGILKYDYPFSPREISLPEALKLHRLYLHPDFHGKGIAQTLFEHCEKIARQNKLRTIWLEVMTSQPQAKRFYQKMGCEPLFHYQLDFQQLLPELRGIEIWKKSLV